MSRGRYLNSPRPRPTVCPVCGEPVPPRVLACTHCGADEKTGWGEVGPEYGALNLPDESFSYDDFLRREFGSPLKPASLRWRWWITGVLLAFVLLVPLVWAFFRSL